MSVFACLGPDATSVRDAYVNRLGANAEVWSSGDPDPTISVIVLSVVHLLH